MRIYSTLCRCPLLIFVLCLAPFACGEEADVDRPGLIYGLGRIEQVKGGIATIDLGDAQTLRVHDRVAVIRDEGSYFTPIGVLRVAETFPTHCRTIRSNVVKVRADDIVMFVREFSQMKTGPQNLDDYLKRQVIGNSGSNGYSTRRSIETAMALLKYSDRHKTWERSTNDVIGYMEGASFANNEREHIQRLFTHIAMMRELFRNGRNSLPAAGQHWADVMPLLFGPTIIAQHDAAQAVATEEDEFFEDNTPGPRTVRQAVHKRMYDRIEEERNVVSFLIATILEQPPRQVALWFQGKLRRSQFPHLADEEIMEEYVREILLELRGE